MKKTSPTRQKRSLPKNPKTMFYTERQGDDQDIFFGDRKTSRQKMKRYKKI